MLCSQLERADRQECIPLIQGCALHKGEENNNGTTAPMVDVYDQNNDNYKKLVDKMLAILSSDGLCPYD